MIKPKKILYENQKEIVEKFLEFINPFFRKYKEINESYLWGSLASGEFGIYEKPFRDQIGSDVDLVLFLERNSEVPKEWQFLHSHAWVDVYRDREFRCFEYKENIHKVDLLVCDRERSVNDLKKINKKLKKKFFQIYENE